MSHRKLLNVLSIFNAAVNTLYLVRFFGVLPPEDVVYGYVPWFMSFALPNIAFTLLSWLLVISLLKKSDTSAVLVGLLNAGGLIFHALNGFMFGFYSGSLRAMTTFNAVFEIVVYAYGLSLAAFYVTQFRMVIKKAGKVPNGKTLT
ncbi:MAG: hypothetical protein FWC20_07910 [Oscillospiraceae bacterium]|nr:hypothetical protein [Oscillospiraceae bacterium]MCL2279312.1 hypothetical protein [Oscillospiraceae bacterium]